MFEDLDLKVTDEKPVLPGAEMLKPTNIRLCGSATCSGKYCC